MVALRMLPTPVDERASNMLKQPNSKGLIMTFNRTLVTILATATLVPSIAFAAVSVGDTVGKTQEEIRSALEKQGYQVREIEVEHDEIEAEVTLDGKSLEIEIAPESGMVVGIEIDDDDYECGDDHKKKSDG